MATRAELIAANAIIPSGEIIREDDTGRRKGGPDADGIQTYNQLPYEGSNNLTAKQLDPDDLMAVLGPSLSTAFGSGNRVSAAAAFAAPPSYNVPTHSVTTTDPLPAGTLVTPKRVDDVATGPVDWDYDTHFRYDGGLGGQNVNATWVVALDSADVNNLLIPEWVTSRNLTQLAVGFRVDGGAEIAYRIVVDGKWHSLPCSRAVIGDNVTTWLPISFPDARARMVRVEMVGQTGLGNGANVQFCGVKIPAGTSISRPTKPIERRGGWVTDSFGAGALDEPPGGANKIETHAWLTLKRLGCDSMFNFSAGGTGMLATDSEFSDRVDEVLAMQPHVFVMGGSINDNNRDGATLDDLNAAWVASLAALGSVPYVITYGPTRTSVAGGNDDPGINAAVRDAARTVGRPFVDVQGVLSGTGQIGTDGTHPTFAGQQTLSAALYDGTDVDALNTAITGMALADTVVSLGVSASPTSGSPVTFTATIAPANAGQVVFRSGITVLATVTVVAGVAAYTTSALTTGVYKITAEFVPATLRARRATSPTATVVVAAPPLSDILLTALLVELTADTPAATLNNGDAIPTLTPARGSKTDVLTAVTAPTLLKPASHGKNAIKRTGTAQALPAPTWAAGTTVGNSITFYAVFRMFTIGTAGSQYVFRGGSAGSRLGLSYVKSADLYSVTTTVSGTPAPQPNPGDTGWQVVCVRMAANAVDVWQNTVSQHATVSLSTSSITLKGLALGEVGGGTSGFEEHISHVLAYDAAHTDAEVIAMMQFLATKWNVTLA